MKIKHWQGYGTVEATRIKNASCTLHIRIHGDHEWGLKLDDEYDLYNWLVRKFDKSIKSYEEWHRKYPSIQAIEWSSEMGKHDYCDYYFTY